MGVGAGLYMCDVIKKFTFSISSPDEFLFIMCQRLVIVYPVCSFIYRYWVWLFRQKLYKCARKKPTSYVGTNEFSNGRIL